MQLLSLPCSVVEYRSTLRILVEMVESKGKRIHCEEEIGSFDNGSESSYNDREGFIVDKFFSTNSKEKCLWESIICEENNGRQSQHRPKSLSMVICSAATMSKIVGEGFDSNGQCRVLICGKALQYSMKDIFQTSEMDRERETNGSIGTNLGP